MKKEGAKETDKDSEDKEIKEGEMPAGLKKYLDKKDDAKKESKEDDKVKEEGYGSMNASKDMKKEEPEAEKKDEKVKEEKEKDRVVARALLQALKGQSQQDVTEDEFAGDYATGEAGQWRNKGPKAHKPATIGDLVGEGQEDLDAIKMLAQGTLTSFQLHIGQEEWDRLVEELKDLEKRDVEQ